MPYCLNIAAVTNNCYKCMYLMCVMDLTMLLRVFIYSLSC